MAKTEKKGKNVVFATIRKGTNKETGEEYKYVSIECDVELKAGEKVYLAKPQENLDSLLKREYIDENEYQERLEKIPDWKLYELTAKNEK